MAEESNVEEFKLPICVMLNPKKGAMWYDDLSGLRLSQWDGTESDGTEIKNWGHVPKNKDCSRIEIALRSNILFPCSPKGECKHIIQLDQSEDWLEATMKLNTRELISTIDQIIDVNILSRMQAWENDRPRRDIRPIVLSTINNRLKSPYVSGVTSINSIPNMILDKKTGKMVEDKVRIT